MSKTHTSAMGKQIDMAALRAKNEKVRAVGNMAVNARGDIIDSNNEVINDNTKRVSAMYQKTMKNAPTKAQPAVATAPKQPMILPDETTSDEMADLDDDIPNPDK